jgi:hypothetical protein
MPHYRRIPGASVVLAVGQTRYQWLARFRAALVGTSGGDIYVHVNGPNDATLPGTYLADDLPSVPALDRSHISVSLYEVTRDGQVVAERIAEADVPGGATVLATGLAPNAFI